MSAPDSATLEKLLADATTAPWKFCETISDDGQEWFGCGVINGDGTEFAWLDYDPEVDIPTASLIAAAPTITADLIATRADRDAWQTTAEAAVADNGRLRMELEALRKAADGMAKQAADLLQHVEDPDLDRAIPGQCTVCHSFRDPLHKAIRFYRATHTKEQTT